MLISFVRRLASLGLYGFAGSLPKYLAYAALEALCFFALSIAVPNIIISFRKNTKRISMKFVEIITSRRD